MDHCAWIAVGFDIEKNSKIYNELLAMNTLLTEKYQSTFVFSALNIPHLNLFDFDLPQKVIPLALKRLDEIAKKARRQKVVIDGVRAFPFGTMYLEVEKHSELLALHEKIVHALSPLRGLCVSGDYVRHWKDYTSEQKKLLKQYGSPHVLRRFTPHITIGHVKPDDLIKSRKELASLRITPTALLRTIHVFKEDTTKEFIKRFQLR